MKHAVGMVVRDEEFYIEMAIRSAVEHAMVFVLDTGSRDRTVPIIHSLQSEFPGKIILHEETFGAVAEGEEKEFRFAKTYRQVDATNFIAQSARDLCDDDGFVVLIDGDEVLNERFWEILETCGNADAIFHSTSLPITPFKVSTHPLDMQQVNGFRLFDPHVRAWRARLGMKWFSPDGTVHILQRWERPPVQYITPDTVHFHLHYSCGPKSIYSYMVDVEQTAEGASKILDMPLREMHNQAYFENRWPEWFRDGRFIPRDIERNIMWNKHHKFVAPMSHPMPEYVVKRWREWGEWLEI